MKRIFTLISIFLLLLSIGGYAQTTGNKGAGFQTKWKTSPFDNLVFIENNGQFDGKIKSGEKILYGVHLGKVDIYFTSHKVIYRYDRIYFKKSSEPNADPDDIKNMKHETHFLETEWEGASQSASVEAKGKKTNYYTYSSGSKTIKASIFKQIVYKNLYPGIDAVYQFTEGKDGIEYSLIVHPGADLSNIKINYTGAKSISRNGSGELIINSELNTLTEHAPTTTYLGETSNIALSTALAGHVESFKADAGYDKTKTIVIDPWITDPLFTNRDKAYDLNWDYFGNVYAYGNDVSNLQLVKMNKLGVIQWTYNAVSISGGYYGAFTADKVTGTSYLCEGFPGGTVLKVNSNGTLVGTFAGDPTDINELWRARFDPCNRNIVIAGGGTSGTYQAGVLDSDMSSINPVNILGATGACHDMSLIAIDPDGNHCYIGAARSLSFDPLHFNNFIMQLPLPSLSPTIYGVHEDCHFIEVSSILYVGDGNSVEANGMNGAAASPNWLYLYNGDTLRRYHKNTGAFVSQFPIRLNSPFEYGGLDVDPCDNIFVGVVDSIYVLDSLYTLQAKIPLQDTVFDVQLGQKGALYACGVGFVTQLTNPVTPTLISSASGTPSSCSACNGTATVNINCGVAPYIYRWSDGNANQTDTGLCAGVYTVTVTDASCPPRIDTAIVNVTGENGFNAFITDTNPDCALRKGNATIHVTGGVPPYQYNWSNGSTKQYDTGLVAGTYVCIVTDNTGCRFEVGVTLVNPTAPKVKIVPDLDSICIGSSIVLNVSGAKTYLWNISPSLSCDTCSNPTATPNVTTTYTVTGMDSIGCTAIVVSTIKVSTPPKPVITGKDSVCSGYIDTLKVTGGTSYLWSTGATTTSINYNTITTQTITVTAHNGLCSGDTSFVIHVVSASAILTASADSVCPGDSVLLTGGGGISYKWSTGKTTSSIWINPLTTKTYTLHAYAGTCNDSVTKLIKVIPKITATISAQNDTICPLGTSTITVAGEGGAVSGYKWSTGATTSAITVTSSVTTTYTATVYGLCDSVQRTMQVVVIPLAKPSISGTNWKCAGIKDTLTVSSLTNPTTYLWSNGKTTTTIVTGGINADSIFMVTAFNSLGCPVTIIDTVLLRQPPSVVANPPAIFCAGQPITLTALANGTYPPFTYNWSTGQTGPSITIDPGPDTTTTYTVTASNGCSNMATTTAIPNVPILYACCNQILFIEHDSANRHDTAILVASGNSKKYQWIEQPDNGSITCLNPPLCDSIRAITTVSTTYTVVGTDSNGCQTEQLLFVTIDIPCFDLTIPNVFTPTNPGILGLDDVFYIKTQNVNGWDLTIYDRWGKEMYHSTNPYQYWNGNTEGGGKAPAGVYYYIINSTCQNSTYKKDGFVQLIR